MKSRLELSIVMSVYNGEKYLREAIESILNQTYTDFEFIIINDGSTDQSLDIIRSYSDQRVVIINQENKGLIESLNIGIARARTNYIARIDADDVSHLDRLEKQIKFMDNNPNLVLLSSSYNVMLESGEIICTRFLPVEDKCIREAITKWNPFCHSSAFFRKKVFEKVGGYSKRYELAEEDYDLWKRIIQHGEVANIREPLIDYRIAPSSREIATCLRKNRTRIKDENSISDQPCKDGNESAIYPYLLRVGISLLEYAPHKRREARKHLRRSLLAKITLSGVYNYLLTYLPARIILTVKTMVKGKYYVP